MADAIERQKIESPFVMGPRPGARPRRKPDLRSRALPRSAFQAGPTEGQYIFNALTQFAGVAGEAYVKQIGKKVDADKAIQTSRAIQGLAPTDETTVAGYKAHATVAIQNQTLKSQARLNQLGTTKHTDEEWEQAIQEEYASMDGFMMDNYDLYSKDLDIQKLSFVSLREMIPQTTAKREANKMKIEIEGRVNIATDTLMNSVEALPLDKSPESMKTLQQITDDTFGALKLTESQKDAILSKAIENTHDPVLVEFSKHYTGQRKTSLFDRNGRIQGIERKLADETIASSAIDFAVEIRGIEKAFYGDPANNIKPTMTEQELTDKVKIRNKQTNNTFMSRGQFNSILDQRDKFLASEYKSRKMIKDILDPSKSDLSMHKKKEIQAGMNKIYDVNLEKITREAQDLSEDERNDYIAEKRQALIGELGDKSVKSDTLIDSWMGELHNLATMNIPANLLEGDVSGYTIEDLPTFAQEAIEKIDNMTVTARDEYLQGLDKREATTLKAFLNLRDMDTPITQALDRAQRIARNPMPIDFKAVDKGLEEVRDSQEYFWWRDDFPANQIPYLEREIREKLKLDPMPASERSVETTANWMEKNWTNAGGLRLKGSPEQLTRATGLHASRLKEAMDVFIKTEHKHIAPLLYGLGLTDKDVYPITDPKRQTVQLRTINGDWLGAPVPLKSIKGKVNTYKVEQEKAITKERIRGTYNKEYLNTWSVFKEKTPTELEKLKEKWSKTYSKEYLKAWPHIK